MSTQDATLGLTLGRRIVVTGLGLVCSAGLDPESHLSYLLESRTGLRPIGRFSTEGIATRSGGEIDDREALAGLTPSERSGLSRATRFALCASRRALQDAMLGADLLASGRVGLVAGICASGESGGELSGLAARESPTLPHRCARQEVRDEWPPSHDFHGMCLERLSTRLCI